MSRDALKNQSRPTKRCQCDRGWVYTDGLPGTKRVNGRLACELCVLDDIITNALNRIAE